MAKDISKILKLEPLNNGLLLEGIFKYQKDLVEKYIALGRLPNLPLDINTRENQKFIRKLIGDFCEELAEASSEIEKGMELMLTKNYTEDEVQAEMRECFKKALVEIADSLHFLVELMIYLNIEPEDIKRFYRHILIEGDVFGLFSEEPLRTTLNYAQHLNIYHDDARIARFKGFRIPDFSEDNLFLLSKVGPELFGEVDRHFWVIARKLFRSQNLLKMKDWRVEEVNSSVESFQLRIMETWIVFFKLIDLCSLNDNHIYLAYEDKNLINQQRIIDNY